MLLARRISRRRFLGMGAAATAVTSLGLKCVPPPTQPEPPVPRPSRADGRRHLSWVWQFSRDGPPEQIAWVLARYNLGILLKTHDGTDWMARYDSSVYAVSGPDQVGVLADYYETYDVPFHAWCVIKGLEPRREAEMAAQVIAAGARSVTVDLEPHYGFWRGTPDDALTFGREFRRRQPEATLYVSTDPRPWVMPGVPLAEFASFAQGFAPQLYWETFNTSGNVRRFEDSGFPVGEEGVTPEFLVNTTAALLGTYDLPIQPAGQGASRDPTAWPRFLAAARDAGMPLVSVWRHGVTSSDVWRLLSGGEPQPEPEPTPTPPSELSVGGRARVANTGSCLNVRALPSARAQIRECLVDGTVVALKHGPVESEGYRWWLIEAETTKGWVAEAEPDVVWWLVPLS